MFKHDIIVIGASAGGIEALRQILHTLPRDLPAAIFIVLHIPATSPSRLPTVLSRFGPLPAVHPENTMVIEHGHIYVAPPDHHILLEEDHIRVVRGPKENRHRPAIDPLFRSAALVYGPRVIGVILTGSLDDGTAGLQVIKQRGGIAVVQNPQEALYPSMPHSAMHNVQVDYCVSLAEIGPLLSDLTHQPVADANLYPVSQNLQKEVEIAKMEKHALDQEHPAGTSSVFSCPDCGGVLWEFEEGDLLRFRCRVGHAYSAETIQEAQKDEIEEALWVALKTLEENVSLSRRLANQAQERGHQWMVRTFEEKMRQAEQRAHIIRDILLNSEKDLPTEEAAS